MSDTISLVVLAIRSDVGLRTYEPVGACGLPTRSLVLAAPKSSCSGAIDRASIGIG